MRFVYATDLHGNRDAIEQTFKLAQAEQADAIVFGGDLTPKSVAIKLARYPDSSREDVEAGEEILLLGGEILPVEMLQKDAVHPTFSQGLRNIKLLNERVGPEALAKHLERKGAIILEQTNQFYELESMLAEQVLLDKLAAFFRDARRPNARASLQLSDEEMEMVRDYVVEWFKELEVSWNEQKRTEFTLKCARALSLQQGDFEQFAPSKYLEECILCGISGNTMLEVIQEVEALLRKKDSRIAEYLLKVFYGVRNRLLRARAYRRGLIEERHITALVEYSTIVQLKRDAENLARIGQEQAKFLRDYFLPLVHEWKVSHGNKPVYAILGNDDIIENISLLEEAESNGLLRHMHGKIHELGGDFVIVGYSFVETLSPEVEYRAWLKDDVKILQDLRFLQSQVGQRHAIWTIHNPAYGYLDQVKNGNAGSKAVLRFLMESQPLLALFGHAHEAPRLTGTCTTQLGETLCVNPGGEHKEGLQAMLINTETLEIKKVKGGK